LPEERMIVQTEQMLDEMCATLAGRAAEKIMFDKISTGALNDLEKVTRQAKAMVSIYGLNEKIGNITYYDSSGQSEYSFSKPYSEETAKIIDEEISQIIETQYQRAISILNENKDRLIELAELLLEKEVIFRDNLIEIFGKRTFALDIQREEEDRVDEENKAAKKLVEKEKAEKEATEKAEAEAANNETTNDENKEVEVVSETNEATSKE